MDRPPRDSRLDVLRLAAVFAVVWLHVSAPQVSRGAGAGDLAWWVGNVASAFSLWCVPVFVMVSGALLLPGRDGAEAAQFYRRRGGRVLIPLIFWTSFYLLLRGLEQGSMSVQEVAWSVLTATPYYHLWYLYMLLGLYLATPFLRTLVAAGSRRSVLVFIAFCFAVAIVEGAFRGYRGDKGGTFLGLFLPYVGYYVAGHYLHTETPRWPRWLLVAVVAASGTLIAGLAGLLSPTVPKAWEIAYARLNPLVIVLSFAVFLLGLGLKFRAAPPPWLTRHATLTLGIYAIHPALLLVLEKLQWRGPYAQPLLGVPAATLVVFLVAAAVARGLAAVPGVRALVR